MYVRFMVVCMHVVQRAVLCAFALGVSRIVVLRSRDQVQVGPVNPYRNRRHVRFGRLDAAIQSMDRKGMIERRRRRDRASISVQTERYCTVMTHVLFGLRRFMIHEIQTQSQHITAQ